MDSLGCASAAALDRKLVASVFFSDFFFDRFLEGLFSILKRKRMPADLDVSFSVHGRQNMQSGRK